MLIMPGTGNRASFSHADFPADKEDLVRCAERTAADDDTVRALRAMPPVSYASFDEVVRSVALDSDAFLPSFLILCAISLAALVLAPLAAAAALRFQLN